MHGILVTGGAGYIGSHTLRALKIRGYVPLCFDNLTTGYRELVGDIPFFQGDLGRPGDLDAAFSSQKISAVIHFASHALVEESYQNPHKYYHDNILNALNLLVTMQKHGVAHIIFSSSCATYGLPARVPIDESTLQDPVNPYGVTKMVIERMLRDYQNAHGIRFVALRYFNAAGAAHDAGIGEWHVPETHLIPRLLEIALGNGGRAELVWQRLSDTRWHLHSRLHSCRRPGRRSCGSTRTPGRRPPLGRLQPGHRAGLFRASGSR